jgi:predicted nucleic acid-binding protein
MALASWIIDASALHKLGSSPDLEVWEERIERGLVSIATVTLLEVGYSVRSHPHYRQVFDSGLIRNLIEVSSSGESEAAAKDIQEKLVARSQHRGVAVPDLLIAGIAIVAGHTVLHHDKDFEIISQVTGQPTERLGL